LKKVGKESKANENKILFDSLSIGLKGVDVNHRKKFGLESLASLLYMVRILLS
jgi:hypothetical protein